MIGIVKPFSVLCEAFVAEMIQQRNLLSFADLFQRYEHRIALV